MENEQPTQVPAGTPSPKAQSWGAFISMVIIVLMVIVGAFYAWGNRLAQNSVFEATTTAQ